MPSTPTLTSGEGSRPVTDGTVDNIGAGKAFNPDRPDVDGPPPKERMSDKRVDQGRANDGKSGPEGSNEVPMSDSDGREADDAPEAGRDR